MTKTTPENTLILVDGSSYLFRAYYALPPLMTSKGEPTGAIYGTINMLKRLVADFAPNYIAVIFDPKGKTFRHEMYEAYKANRAETPEDLSAQIGPLQEIIRAQGFPLIVKDGVEADDVIGTLTKQAHELGFAVRIVTNDKDMAQLVNADVHMVNTMKNTEMDADGVVEKFGVKPEQIIDYLALMGDTSDNVPGVPKVGPKTAAKWLQQYGSVKEIVLHADEIKGKVGESLRENLELLDLSQDLVTIRCDVPLENVEIENLVQKAPDKKTLVEYYSRFEFNRLLQMVSEGDEVVEEAAVAPAVTIISDDAWQELLAQLTSADVFAFDTETTSLDPFDAEIVGLSFALPGSAGVYIPLAHDYEGVGQQLSRDKVLAELKPLLEENKPVKVGHNLKYDLRVLRRYDITLRGIATDSMLESYVFDSTGSRHDLDSLSLKYLDHQNITFEEVAGKGVKQKRFDEVAIEVAAPYAAEDAEMTLALHQIFAEKINAEPGLQRVLAEIELPLLPILAEMEETGVLIDAEKLQAQSKGLALQMEKLEQEAFKLAGEEFNLNSPKQLQVILFEKQKLPIVAKTPKGQPSTAESALQELALTYPLPQVILEYRSLSKLKNTYTDPLPECIHASTGRVHTSFQQAVAATGRLSSTNPNLQNIPIRNAAGRQVRQAFIAPPGYKLMSLDYSQIELRIMAHLSQDESLLRAFAEGRDIHQHTAAEVFGVKLEDVTSEQRRRAKAVNFGLLYGMSAFGLAKQLGIERSDAQTMVDQYFLRYPSVKKYIKEMQAVAAKKGYVETLLGRRLNLAHINSRNVMQKKAAERVAINAPMQGTAADLIKLAMIAVDKLLAQGDLDARMILQVHDELVFEVAEREIEKASQLLADCMTQVMKLDVPLLVSIGVGDNWDSAH